MADFEQIYRDYFRDVFLYLRQLSGGNEQLAEDITSEVFSRALRCIDSFRGDCDIRVWLCQIAKNCYFTYLKQSSKTQFAADVERYMLEAEELPEEILLRSETVRQIKKLLHELPDPYKEVFMWRVLGEMSFKQIGGAFSKDGELGVCHLSSGTKNDTKRNGGLRG